MRQRGFTIIEVLVVIVLLGLGAWIFFSERATVIATAADSQSKVAINAMYYSLEEAYYPTNGYYPETIDSKIIRTIDPELFVDPSGVKLGDSGSTYHYEASNCSNDGKCKSYRLSADMQREAEYVKTSRHN